MARDRSSKRIFGALAGIGKALASGVRLEIIELLAQGERTVDEIAKTTRLSVANASHHLHVLRAEGLAVSRKRGLFVRYRLTGPAVFDLFRAVRTVGERHVVEVERIVDAFFKSREDLDPVGREDLLDRIRAGTVVVLDVRPEVEYRAGHVAAAISVPLREIERRIAEIPRSKMVVAYCRGPYCVLALKAVEKLRALGRRARRLVDGFPEWQAAGFPVEIGGTG